MPFVKKLLSYFCLVRYDDFLLVKLSHTFAFGLILRLWAKDLVSSLALVRCSCKLADIYCITKTHPLFVFYWAIFHFSTLRAFLIFFISFCCLTRVFIHASYFLSRSILNLHKFFRKRNCHFLLQRFSLLK